MGYDPFSDSLSGLIRFFLGDIVRRNGKEELGTVLSLESRATVRVLETNNHLSSICGNRLGTFY